MKTVSRVAALALAMAVSMSVALTAVPAAATSDYDVWASLVAKNATAKKHKCKNAYIYVGSNTGPDSGFSATVTVKDAEGVVVWADWLFDEGGTLRMKMCDGSDLTGKYSVRMDYENDYTEGVLKASFKFKVKG